MDATLAPKDELLARSDVISIQLVLDDRTHGLIGGRGLGLMKRRAYLVNTSRGPIVDEAALIRARRDGAIAGAGLDVFDEEPLPLDHPFRSLPNTVITPHLGYVTEETNRVFYGHAVEDIKAYLDGALIRVLRPYRGPALALPIVRASGGSLRASAHATANPSAVASEPARPIRRGREW